MPSAIPTIGPISGAMIIAPMIEAVESAMSPTAAIVEARPSRIVNRVSLSPMGGS